MFIIRQIGYDITFMVPLLFCKQNCMPIRYRYYLFFQNMTTKFFFCEKKLEKIDLTQILVKAQNLHVVPSPTRVKRCMIEQMNPQNFTEPLQLTYMVPNAV